MTDAHDASTRANERRREAWLLSGDPKRVSFGGVKRWFQLLLAIGALMSLSGQQAAYAAGPHRTAAPPAASQISAHCQAGMQQHRPQQDRQPCHSGVLDCIGATGCVVPIVLAEADEPAVLPWGIGGPSYWSETSPLRGVDLSPEPHPPMAFG